MTDFQVRAAHAVDIRAYYGHDLPFTARAWVAEENGEIIGIAGYYLPGGPAIVFSTMRPAMRRHLRVIVREARRIMREIPSPMYCYADKNEESAPRFLSALGWEHVATEPEGEVYLWQTD